MSKSNENPMDPIEAEQPEYSSISEPMPQEDVPQFSVKKPHVFAWFLWIFILFMTSLFWFFLQIIGFILMPLLALLAASLWAKTGNFMLNKFLFKQLEQRKGGRGSFLSRLFLLSYTGYDQYYVEPLTQELNLSNVFSFMKKRGIDVLISNVGIAFTITWFITLPMDLENANSNVLTGILIIGVFMATFALAFYLPFAWVLKDTGFKSYNPKTFEVKLISKAFKNRLDRFFGISGIFAAGDVISRIITHQTNVNIVVQYSAILLIFTLSVFFLGGQSLLAALFYLMKYHSKLVNQTRQRLIQDPDIELAHTIIQPYNKKSPL